MKWAVTVKPNAKKAKVLQIEPHGLVVFVNAPPSEGKANQRLIELLAEHFGVAKSRVKIFRGENSKKKLVELL